MFLKYIVSLTPRVKNTQRVRLTGFVMTSAIEFVGGHFEFLM